MHHNQINPTSQPITTYQNLSANNNYSENIIVEQYAEKIQKLWLQDIDWNQQITRLFYCLCITEYSPSLIVTSYTEEFCYLVKEERHTYKNSLSTETSDLSPFNPATATVTKSEIYHRSIPANKHRNYRHKPVVVEHIHLHNY